jgi:hypothetical protein
MPPTAPSGSIWTGSIWTATWRRGHLEARAACKRIVGMLALAARADCEQALGTYVLARIAAGDIPSLHALEQRFEPERNRGATLERDALQGTQHPLSLYDSLLPSHNQSMELH